MAIDAQSTPPNEQKTNDKEYNFRALEAKHEKDRAHLLAQLQQEREDRERLSREIEEIKNYSRKRQEEDEENYSEPYVDDKRLNKKLEKFEKKSKADTKADIETAVQRAIYEERKTSYLKQNPDFISTLQNHAEKLLQKDPELAETILEMPEGFERQKLVYKNIKALGLDKPEPKQQSVQEKIDANRKNPYYIPTSQHAPPYANGGDFSETGQKSGYEQMKKLQKSLRLG